MSAPGPEPVSVEGWVARELQAEFPALALVSLAVTGRPVRSPAAVLERLAALSSRFRGAGALTMRESPVPAAYRNFSRQVGLDPDVTPPPSEAMALERLLAGGFATRDVVADALLIALVETGVPVWALDADTLDGPLGLRPALAGEALGRGTEGGTPPAGRLVVADAAGPAAELLGDVASGHQVTRATRRLTLFAVLAPPASRPSTSRRRCGPARGPRRGVGRIRDPSGIADGHERPALPPIAPRPGRSTWDAV